MVLKVRFRVAKGQNIPWGFIRGQISKRHYLSVPYMLLKSQHAEFFLGKWGRIRAATLQYWHLILSSYYLCKIGWQNNDHAIAVFLLGPKDAGFDSVWSPCSIHFSLLRSGTGAVPRGYKLKRSAGFKFSCDLCKFMLWGDSAVMLLPINCRSLSIQKSELSVQ